MESNKIKLINRRDALAMFSAIGIAGIAGVSGLTKNVYAGKTKQAVSANSNTDFNKDADMKTIGILGGLGPQATLDFENQIHQVSQRLIPHHQNGGYPPMLVYYCRHPPILLNEDFSPRFPIAPDPRLLEAARKIGQFADFLVIPSNGAHLLQTQIEQAAGRKVLSMIKITLEEIQRRKWKNVGVLGLGEPMVYTKPLEELKINYEIIDGELRTALDDAIMKVMEGRDNAASVLAARKAIESLRTKKVDGIILGCTELPLLLAKDLNAPDLVNPTRLLAEGAVKYAIASV